MIFAVRNRFLLHLSRMEFNLVYHRTDRYRFQFTVSCHEITCRLMDKHQIDVVGSKQFQALFYRSLCQILAQILVEMKMSSLATPDLLIPRPTARSFM